MMCFSCGNCQVQDSTYFCLMKNDFVTRESSIRVVEKVRSGWKKGDTEYEQHRRKTRKVVEVE